MHVHHNRVSLHIELKGAGTLRLNNNRIQSAIDELDTLQLLTRIENYYRKHALTI